VLESTLESTLALGLMLLSEGKLVLSEGKL
jgi:hypothetical protein